VSSLAQEHLKFVIVGHVDHGKSTLVGRLLFDTESLPAEKIEEVRRSSEELGRPMEFCFVMDHLEEERSRGITIDTAQTYFATGKRRYVIIDAPGHKEFMHNMITGASQAEAALLIVDAVEGVREQTRRHAYLLKMLGLEQVIAVINKMDLTGFSENRFHAVKQDLLSILASIGLTPAWTIPISARMGDNVAFPSGNMPWYEGPTVLDGLDGLRSSEEYLERPLRFPIQDIYEVRQKVILVGRVESGSIRRGETIVFHPPGEKSVVRSIEMLWRERSEASTGESIGITLEHPVSAAAGMVACAEEAPPAVTQAIRANIFWMSARQFHAGERLLLRLATQEIPVELKIERKIDAATLVPIEEFPDSIFEAEVAEVQIVAARSFVAECFNHIRELGRFVLSRDLDIVAGGIITDALPR
jgi:small GTP-binding protein